MPIITRAFPLLRPVEELHAFASALRQRSADTGQFYRQYGVSHESWHVQDTPNGPWVIGVTVVDDPDEAAPRFANASEEFHAWFKSQILYLSGVDPNTTPLGPPTTQIFEWYDSERSKSIVY
jgi:hypothetical protein